MSPDSGQQVVDAAVAGREAQFRDFLGERDIRRAVHFTRVENVASILKHGLLPRSEFERFGVSPVLGDAQRLDGHLNGLSLSISHANVFVLRAMWKRIGGRWVVLSLRPDVVFEHPCKLFDWNAAFNRGAGALPLATPEWPSVKEFKYLFLRLPIWQHENVRPRDPSEAQSEVMVLERILPEEIVAISCAEEEVRELVQAAVGNAGRTNIDVEVRRSDFNQRPRYDERRTYLHDLRTGRWRW